METLFNSNKEIILKIMKRLAKDKIVILNTGKNQTELEEFYDILPRVCYLNCIFGALV